MPDDKRGVMTITLPVPHEHLRGNARYNWQGKSRLIKAHREMAMAAVDCIADSAKLVERRGPRLRGLKAAIWRAVFYFPDALKRDAHNFSVGCKSYLDGFTDAGVWIDDNKLTELPTLILIERGCRPRCEIEIFPADVENAV